MLSSSDFAKQLQQVPSSLKEGKMAIVCMAQPVLVCVDEGSAGSSSSGGGKCLFLRKQVDSAEALRQCCASATSSSWSSLPSSRMLQYSDVSEVCGLLLLAGARCATNAVTGVAAVPKGCGLMNLKVLRHGVPAHHPYEHRSA
jgi:hypothetical protein